MSAFTASDIARYVVNTNISFETDSPAVSSVSRHRPQKAGDRSSNPLRPRRLADLVGQAKLKGYLRRIVDSSRLRGVPLDHTLLIGSAGSGKTTVASIIANEMGVDCYQLEAPVAKQTLLELREVVKDGDIIFIDEIHRQGIGKSEDTAPEIMYHFLEDNVIPTQQGLLPFPKVTVIGATTDEGELPRPMLDRFPLKPVIAPYALEDLATIAGYNATALGLGISRDACIALAMASGDAPRNINSLVKNSAAICTGSIDLELAREVIIDLNGMTLDGLTRSQQDYLTFLFGQRREAKNGDVTYQASMSTIATGIGKPRDPKGMGQIVEPLLISRHLVQITNQGRQLTPAGVRRAEQLRQERS